LAELLRIDTTGLDLSISNNMFLSLPLEGIGLPKKVLNTLRYNSNLRTVLALVCSTEADLLRIPSFGRESLRHVKKALQSLDLRLGMDLPGGKPDPIKPDIAAASAARRVLAIGQAPLGATFEAGGDALRINPAGSENDFEAAEKPIVQQLHPEIIRKAARFRSVAPRLDNQIGWAGISALSERLYELVNRPTEEVPEILGTLYSGALELGSFLEMDRKIEGGESSFAPPLDVEVSRPLEDLLRSLAPWLRSFPTVREMDDEAGRFLTRDPLIEPSSSVLDAAISTQLIISEDAAALRALIAASDRGEFQGVKAGHRGVLSIRNMIVAATSAIGLFLLSAVESDFATKSVLVQKAGTFLAKAEGPIMEVLAGLPQDLRLAVEAMISETRDQPPIRPRQPIPRVPAGSERARGRPEPGDSY
jgi:hypothetical protein